MNIKKCENGHFYDINKTMTCPICERMGMLLFPEKYQALGDIRYLRNNIYESQFAIVPKPNYILRRLKKSIANEKKNMFLHDVEIRNMLKGCHHIVQIESCSEENDTVYILEEYCTPISDYQKENKLKYIDILVLAEHIVFALIECRNKGIFHLDVNSDNIFISNNGFFKLSNFSSSELSTKVFDKKRRIDIFHENMSFVAPEVIIDSYYSEQSEIYSLGIVLYEILNEQILPFMFDLRMDEANCQRLTGTPLPEPLHGTAEMKTFVLKACEYDRKSRFASYEELLDEIENLKNNLSIPENEITVSFNELSKLHCRLKTNF